MREPSRRIPRPGARRLTTMPRIARPEHCRRARKRLASASLSTHDAPREPIRERLRPRTTGSSRKDARVEAGVVPYRQLAALRPTGRASTPPTGSFHPAEGDFTSSTPKPAAKLKLPRGIAVAVPVYTAVPLEGARARGCHGGHSRDALQKSCRRRSTRGVGALFGDACRNRG